MPEKQPLKIITADGLRDFDERILRYDLEHTFKFKPDHIDDFVTLLPRYAVENNFKRILGDDIVLAIHRANTTMLAEVGLKAIFADTIGRHAEIAEADEVVVVEPPPLPDDESPPVISVRNGPIGPYSLGMMMLVDNVRPVDRDMAAFIESGHSIVEMAVAHALRSTASAISLELVEKDLLTAEQAEKLTGLIKEGAGPSGVPKAAARRFVNACHTLDERGVLKNEEAFRDTLAHDVLESVLGRRLKKVPEEFIVPPNKDVKYVIISSTERSGRADTPMGMNRYPLFCKERVEIYDDIEAQERTYQTTVQALLTDDSPSSDEVYVDYHWKLDRAVDLPMSHARYIESNQDTAIYNWNMVERSTTEPVLEELFEKANKALEENEDKLIEKAVEKATEFIGQTVLGLSPIPIPSGAQEQIAKAAGKAVGAILGWLIDLIRDLLDTSARLFPVVNIVHVVIWQPPIHPINIVAIGISSADGSTLTALEFGRFQNGKIEPHWSFDRRERRSVRWVGPSEKAGQMPKKLMELGADYTSGAGLWRPAKEGMGAVVRLKNLTDDGIYSLALRTDMRMIVEDDEEHGVLTPF